ncbi:unnamed protein product [Caenorhabditis auriculariae]|uniref:Uncharacterized protein n=1 Tax=Caenorhabditis auriculariae TaxID=2777116 RepID=A0A8S1HSM3_9PELO|nr:unnamed protein product [Caenorhabditis auriculariae]
MYKQKTVRSPYLSLTYDSRPQVVNLCSSETEPLRSSIPAPPIGCKQHFRAYPVLGPGRQQLSVACGRRDDDFIDATGAGNDMTERDGEEKKCDDGSE